MELSADKSKLRLTIDAALNASAVEQLIADLARLRAGMTPAVPEQLPAPAGGEGQVPPALVQSDPYMSLQLLKAGVVRMYARSEGLGWTAFDLPERTARSIRGYLESNVPERSLAGDLVNRKFLY